MPAQADLFTPPPPRTCGFCVHRNAPLGAAAGPCTPMAAVRQRDDAPCESFFDFEQLHLAMYGRRSAA
jgi:hypothetical protein